MIGWNFGRNGERGKKEKGTEKEGRGVKEKENNKEETRKERGEEA